MHQLHGRVNVWLNDTQRLFCVDVSRFALLASVSGGAEKNETSEIKSLSQTAISIQAQCFVSLSWSCGDGANQ